MEITVNGAPYTFSGQNITELLEAYMGQAPGGGVAVAKNGNVIPKSSWDTEIKPGDNLDILVAVQGG